MLSRFSDHFSAVKWCVHVYVKENSREMPCFCESWLFDLQIIFFHGNFFNNSIQDFSYTLNANALVLKQPHHNYLVRILISDFILRPIPIRRQKSEFLKNIRPTWILINKCMMSCHKFFGMLINRNLHIQHFSRN